MKYLVVLVSIIMSFSTIAQNDFRKMNWGESVDELKATYPDVSFDEVKDDFWDLFYLDTFEGIDALILFRFFENQLLAVFIEFSRNVSYGKSAQVNLNEYSKVSSFLREKYVMKNENKWEYPDFKDRYSSKAFELEEGNVKFEEVGYNSNTSIIHSLEKKEPPYNNDINSYQHLLIYFKT